MGLLSFTRPKNSLLLSYDPITSEDVDLMEAQIREVGQYYRFAKLSELGDGSSGKFAQGLACVLILNPRKSFFLRGLSVFLDGGIPFTLFLRPECVGMNRLPVDDELAAYHRAYPEKVTMAEVDRVLSQNRLFPDLADAFLRECRSKVGPLPIPQLDPTLFCTTWGKILDIPPELREFGIYVDISPETPTFSERLKFARTQSKEGIHWAYAPSKIENADAMKKLEIRGLVTGRSGAVERGQDPWDLPTWDFQAIEV